MASFQAQIDELKKDPISHHVQPANPPSRPVNIQEEIQEVLEKQQKKLNLVVVGLPETDKKSVRSDDDKQFIMGMCDEVGVSRDDVIDVFRNGQVKDDKTPEGLEYSRITKVKFSSLSSKLIFMKKFKASKPSDEEYSGTYVRPDLTFRERLVDKALRDKLFAQRELNPTADLIIRRGNIVPRSATTSQNTQ